MKKEYSFMNTYFDDVTENNQYAKDDYTIFTSYHGAIKHYYKIRKAIEKDNDCRSITPLFPIKKITLFFHHDFSYKVKEKGSNETKIFYSFIKAFIFQVKENIRLTYNFIKLAIKYKSNFAWELYKMMYKKLSIVF